MKKRHYPPLDEKQISLIQQLFAVDPDYFKDPSCPYSQEVIKLFEGDNPVKDFDEHTISVDEMSDDDIVTEISELHSKLKTYWDDVKSSDKSTDKNTFFRVSVTLMERIVDLREQMSNIKNVNLFTSEILSIMEQVLTADQRNEVIDRLKKFDMGNLEPNIKDEQGET